MSESKIWVHSGRQRRVKRATAMSLGRKWRRRLLSAHDTLADAMNAGGGFVTPKRRAAVIEVMRELDGLLGAKLESKGSSS